MAPKIKDFTMTLKNILGGGADLPPMPVPPDAYGYVTFGLWGFS